jgi:hypothetical protein
MLIEWWEAWLVVAITINTCINTVVFFRGRKILRAGVSNDKTNSNKIRSERNKKQSN